MRVGTVFILGLLATALTAFADDKLAVLKAGGESYSNVNVMKVTATDVYFVSDKGLANVKLKDLDPVLQQHFHYNATRAVEAAAREQQKTIKAQGATGSSSAADIKSQMEAAMDRVREIVNQPVTGLSRTPDMQVATFSPGWFHPGAEKPDFNTVDVRTTQTFPYDEYPYVNSDLNPDVVFIGRELEFNPMTKYFYTDRTVPKKKLTEEEMLEINRLYRLIGKYEQQLDQLQNPQSPLTPARLWVGANKPILAAGAALLVGVLLFLRAKHSKA